MKLNETLQQPSYLELLLDAYYNAPDVSSIEKSEFESHKEILKMTKNFVDNWKKNNLPDHKMNFCFRNKVIRELILNMSEINEEELDKIISISNNGLPGRFNKRI